MCTGSAAGGAAARNVGIASVEIPSASPTGSLGCVTLTNMDDGNPMAEGREGWAGEQAELKYSNSMSIAGGPFDVTLTFGQQDNSLRPADGTPPAATEIVRLAMSWGHLKSMIPLMARVVADYEQQVGEIPAPGFDQNWKA